MGIRTKIQWCDSTCNLCIGCSQPCEVGSACFAEQLCRRFAGKNPGFPADFHKPQLFLHRLADLRKWPDLRGKKREVVLKPWKPFQSSLEDRGVVIPAKPWLDGMPRWIFLSDLGEMFDPALPSDYLAEPLWKLADQVSLERMGLWHCNSILNVLRDSPHILIILTKQARRMAEFFATHPCPQNFWLGVSVTDQSTLWRVDELLKIDCKVRIISHEPATGGIDYGDRLKGIQWVISGGMSSRGAAPCDLAWLRADRDQAKAAETALFCKQLGAEVIDSDLPWWLPGDRLYYKHASAADPVEWPADLRVREVPKPEPKPAAGHEGGD